MVCKISRDKNNNLTFFCKKGKKNYSETGFCGEKLRKIRKKNGLSLHEASWSVLIQTSRLWGAENKNDELHPLTIERLAKLYNVDKKAFFVNPKEIEKKERELIENISKSIK